MTDRQTDKDIYNQRSQWWLVTCYDDNIDRIEDAKLMPKCVKAIHGGREKCPTSGRIHFQGAIECHGQQRGVFFRDWLPRVHFERAKSKEAVKKYCLKEDTAAGPKLTVSNPVKYMTMDDILSHMGVCYYESMESGELIKVIENAIRTEKEEKELGSEDAQFWYLCTMMLRKHGKHLASSLANPAIRKMWIHTKVFWLEAALSITAQPDKVEDLENEIIFSGKDIDESDQS